MKESLPQAKTGRGQTPAASASLDQSLWRNLFQHSADGMIICGERVVEANVQAARLFGCQANDLAGLDPRELGVEITPGNRRCGRDLDEKIKLARQGTPQYFYWRARRRDGGEVDTESMLQAIGPDPAAGPLLWVLREVSESVRLSAALARSQAEYSRLYQTARRDEQLLRSLLAVSGDPIAIFDAEGKCQFVNQAACSFFGWKTELAVGLELEALARPVAPSRLDLAADLAAGRVVTGLEARLTAGDGQPRTATLSAAGVFSEQGRLVMSLVIFHDVSAQREAELALHRAYEMQKDLAERDSLTGLLNHRRLHEEMLKEVERSKRQGDVFSIIMLDLDKFKALNDEHGHLVGDEALKLIGRVLRRNCRVSDLVGRFGGDEFLVILPATDTRGAMIQAERFLNDLDSSHILSGGENLAVASSMGVATYPIDSASLPNLIHLADRAMYRSKSSGRNVISTADESQAHFEKPCQLDSAFQVILALTRRDHYSRIHCQRTAELAERLARLAGLDEAATENITKAAMIHDIGNIYVPEDILSKPTQLTAEEMDIVRQHPVFGHSFLRHNCESDEDILVTVLHHHERWDGRGYPHRLAGQGIPLPARIVALADAASAMSLKRPWRDDAFGPADIARELQRMAGTVLDPDLVGRFLEADESFRP